MGYNIEYFLRCNPDIRTDVAVCCEDKTTAIDVLEQLERLGYMWHSGVSPTNPGIINSWSFEGGLKVFIIFDTDCKRLLFLNDRELFDRGYEFMPETEEAEADESDFNSEELNNFLDGIVVNS